jgi:hypothetical protein
MFRDRMPGYEVFSAAAMATLDKGRRLMTKVGAEFMDGQPGTVLLGELRALDARRRQGHRDLRRPKICRQKLAEHEPSRVDDAICEESEAYIARRRTELGD